MPHEPKSKARIEEGLPPGQRQSISQQPAGEKGQKPQQRQMLKQQRQQQQGGNKQKQKVRELE
jgi:hypothetical protein